MSEQSLMRAQDTERKVGDVSRAPFHVEAPMFEPYMQSSCWCSGGVPNRGKARLDLVVPVDAPQTAALPPPRRPHPLRLVLRRTLRVPHHRLLRPAHPAHSRTLRDRERRQVDLRVPPRRLIAGQLLPLYRLLRQPRNGSLGGTSQLPLPKRQILPCAGLVVVPERLERSG
ncbi:hypothetical protein CALCODRAFT_360614 [Calocera cornea HHB12733]|uniref:Uncharacterized protein n=1 Tax=Calocera cornea HHB12733 TaxID=1353952 RepID=A0A165EMS0_9BASI|nr:hypothetical protein CALCODRAFT_360614 [Calocera cornea HHB12733]